MATSGRGPAGPSTANGPSGDTAGRAARGLAIEQGIACGVEMLIRNRGGNAAGDGETSNPFDAHPRRLGPIDGVERKGEVDEHELPGAVRPVRVIGCVPTKQS